MIEHHTFRQTAASVYIAIPTHDGRLHITTMFSIINLMGQLAYHGIKTGFQFTQSSDICQARSVLAAEFLKTDFSHLLMIDSDLMFDPKQAVKLMGSGHLVCGGAYPKKTPSLHPEFTVEYEGPSIEGFRKANYIGGGLILVHREVFGKLKTRYPELTAKSDETGEEFTSYFQNGIIDGRYRSEDAAFCYRWNKCGGQVWVLEDCAFTHFGTFGWSGNFMDLLAKIEEKDEAA
jgi:hypothetical protein